LDYVTEGSGPNVCGPTPVSISTLQVCTIMHYINSHFALHYIADDVVVQGKMKIINCDN